MTQRCGDRTGEGDGRKNALSVRRWSSPLRHSSHRLCLPLWISASALWALCVPAFFATAQPATPPVVGPQPPTVPPREITQEQADQDKARINKALDEVFRRGDWPEAEKLLRELVPLDHENFVPWYNLACALAMQGKLDESVQMLRQSIARGFADRTRLETDPHLAPIRNPPREDYQRIIASWDRILEQRAADAVERARREYKVGQPGSPYALERDEALRLVYISAFDPALFAQAKQEVTRLTEWWNKQVLPADEPWRGEKDASTPWVVVVLPTRKDYQAWAQQRYGALWDRIGGAYAHDDKQLVSMDLGSTLRHEYWHVLHWRHVDRMGQRHPLWVMEGLCSLVEDVDTAPDGSMVAKPSWRTNMARRLNKGGALTPWETLFEMDRKRFIGTRPLAFYAQARAVFMYLATQGKLRDWYTAYVQTFKEDPSGKAAFVRAFGRPLKETERDYRAWLKTIPEVVEEVGSGPANLPFDVDAGGGDGPTIASVPSILGGPRTEQDWGGLKFRDVITAIDGKPVRDLNDLARLLGEHEAGETVEVGYRRGTPPRAQHGAAKVTLVPPRR